MCIVVECGRLSELIASVELTFLRCAVNTVTRIHAETNSCLNEYIVKVLKLHVCLHQRVCTDGLPWCSVRLKTISSSSVFLPLRFLCVFTRPSEPMLWPGVPST